MQLLNEPTDLTLYPTNIISADNTQPMEYTVGDLHGNMIKKVHFLIKCGIIHMEPDFYKNLVECYLYFEELSDQLYDLEPEEWKNVLCVELKRIVGYFDLYKCVLTTIKVIDTNKARSIGDDIGDRGANDMLTLLLDAWLRQGGLDNEVLLSNHGIETYHAYEMLKTGRADKLTAPFLGAEFVLSLNAMNELFLNTGIVTKEEFFELIETGYQPGFKALGYTADYANNAICIYSHAAIDPTVIMHIANKLGVEYQWTNIRTKAATIDRINTAFAIHVKNNTVHTLYDYDAMERGYEYEKYGPLNPANHPFEFLMLNRSYDVLQRDALHNGEKQFFSHGHDEHKTDSEHIFCIDEKLGKKGYILGRIPFTKHDGYLHVVQGPYTPVKQQKNTIDPKFFEDTTALAVMPTVVANTIPIVDANTIPIVDANTIPIVDVAPKDEIKANSTVASSHHKAIKTLQKKSPVQMQIPKDKLVLLDSLIKRNGAVQQPTNQKGEKQPAYKANQPARFAKSNLAFFIAVGTGAVVSIAVITALITTGVLSVGASLGVGLAVFALGLAIGLIIKAIQHKKNTPNLSGKTQQLSQSIRAVAV